MGVNSDADDSHSRFGGFIPGASGVHAFLLSGPRPSAIPILIAVPHAGRAYSPPILQALRDPRSAALRLEDRFVDRLGEALARDTGAALLVANAPRAMIDLNRGPGDVDWDMFARSDRPDFGDTAPSRRARSGLGLIPRRAPGIGELWNRNHREEELSARLSGIHEPYHAALAETLAELRARWGVAMLIDLHSMPPIQPKGANPPPEIVLGDRFGASCHGKLVSRISAYFHDRERVLTHNRPYAGGYVLERHGNPAAGIHAIQLEIDRTVYLDQSLTRLGDGFGKLASLLTGLVRDLATELTQLSESASNGDFREAAE